MEALTDKFVTIAKTLPGFGLAYLFATLAYVYLKQDYTKLSPKETFVTASACWLLYHLASNLDSLYNAFYGPKSKLERLWKIKDLRTARNNAAVALFGPIDPRVTDYATATTYKHVTDEKRKSLYYQCSRVAKPTEVWSKTIEPKIDVSKAARTVFVFAVLALVIAQFPPLMGVLGVASYIDQLGRVLWEVWALGIALVALLLYVRLRVLHNVDLFNYVANNVRHLPVGDARAAVIFEISFSKKTP